MRRRGRTLPVLAVLLVVAPLVELYVLIQVGQVVGALWTVAALVVVSLLGAALLRREGWRTWRAFTTASSAGRLPAAEVADGALVLLAGALLLTPGFLSDVVGLLLLVPPVRAVLRRAVLAYATRRVLPGMVDGVVDGVLRRPTARGSRVVEGEVVDGPADDR